MITTLKTLRGKLHLTQPQLANLLGVTLGVVAMAECGKRKLPGKCLPRLLEIEQMAYREISDDAASKKILTTQSSQLLPKLNRRLKVKRTMLNKHTVVLQRMKEEFQGTLRAADAFLIMAREMPGEGGEMSYVRAMGGRQNVNARNCGLEKQAELRRKIAMVEGDIAAMMIIISELEAHV